MSSNPKYLGPGYWASWHIRCLKTDTESKKIEAARAIIFDISGFPCMECRAHAIGYVREHPVYDKVYSKDPLSLFKWTVSFHNFVNKRLDKKMFNWEDAKKLWEKDNICMEDCDKDEIKEEIKDETEKDFLMNVKNY